jgi:DNA invertase Pin-like site-specific DNA recombinase
VSRCLRVSSRYEYAWTWVCWCGARSRHTWWNVGVAFVSLAEGIDATTPAGKLQMHILGAIAEFERARLRERTTAGLRRAKAQGTVLGRRAIALSPEALEAAAGLSVRAAALALGVSVNTLQKARRRLYQQTCAARDQEQAQIEGVLALAVV